MPLSPMRHFLASGVEREWPILEGLGELRDKTKMGRQPRSGDFSLAIGPLDPEMDRR